MNFDFSKFATQDLSDIKKEMDLKDAKINGEIEIEEIEEIEDDIELIDENEKISRMTWEEKMDYWIDKYKDTPKIVYEELSVICTYDDKTHIVTILDKKTGVSVEFEGEQFFQDAVFNTKSRLEKAKLVLDKFKEITGDSISKSFEDNRDSSQDDVEDIKIDEDIEDEADINIPDII